MRTLFLRTAEKRLSSDVFLIVIVTGSIHLLPQKGLAKPRILSVAPTTGALSERYTTSRRDRASAAAQGAKDE